MDEIKRKALEQILAGKQPLSSSEFTKPGEDIPQNADLIDFIKYNVAHIDPKELAMQMGMASGGIGKIGKGLGAAEEATQIAAPKPSEEAIKAAEISQGFRQPMSPAPEALSPEKLSSLNSPIGPSAGPAPIPRSTAIDELTDKEAFMRYLQGLKD